MSELKKENLDICFMFSSIKQRNVWIDILKSFNSIYRNIKINNYEYSQEVYKDSIEDWLNEENRGDVFLWFAGERLKYFIQQRLVEPLDSLYKENNLENNFYSNVFDGITYNNSIYAIPLSRYHWGIYYRKSIFKKFGFSEPQSFDELIRIADTLKEKNIIPFSAGFFSGWPAAAWFDYLNLRLNGYNVHKELMDNKIFFNDERIVNVFKKIKEMIDNNYFNNDFYKLDLYDCLELFTTKKSAMILMGNFLVNEIDKHTLKDIDFFRFPVINNNLGIYEDSPTDVIFISSKSKNKDSATKFIKFLSNDRIQTILNKKTEMIPLNKNSKIANDYFIKKGYEMLKRSDGYCYFFDRDFKSEIVNYFNVNINNLLTGKMSIEEFTDILTRIQKKLVDNL